MNKNMFSERLKDLRQEKKLSQRELAKVTGFTQPAIARWENGLQLPNIEALKQICKALSVSADYLIGLED